MSYVLKHMFQKHCPIVFNAINIFVRHIHDVFSIMFLCRCPPYWLLVLKNIPSKYGRIVYHNLRPSFIQFTRHTSLFTRWLKTTSLSSNDISTFLLESTAIAFAASLFVGIVALEIRAKYPCGTDLPTHFNMQLVWTRKGQLLSTSRQVNFQVHYWRYCFLHFFPGEIISICWYMNVRTSKVEGTLAPFLYGRVCMATSVKNMKLLLKCVL